MLETYDEKTITAKCLELWARENVYSFDPSLPREKIYAIDTPPPTVSGSLHIGHIYGYTQADILARFHRMRGKNLFFPIGWDDNGLPTERRVQNYFNIKCDQNMPYEAGFHAEHKDKFDEPQRPVSRKNFIEHCRRLIEQDEKIFESILREMGMSYDWKLMYSTISDAAIELAQQSFLKMYENGHVKSIDAPTMWDTEFQTAVAQAETEDREIPGFFHDIKFAIAPASPADTDTARTPASARRRPAEATAPDARGEGNFVISTTRPEFLPACIAVVAHPDDPRYRHLIGRTAVVPLFGQTVKIYGDPHADPKKGTGIMMICTFGDAEDVRFWKEHGLPLKQIIGKNGRIINVNNDFNGLTVKAARKLMAEKLRECGDLVGDPRPITHSVKFYEKGDTPIEFVPSRQWFALTLDKKDALLAAADEIRWTPEYMKSRFANWTKNLGQNWAISRQRFFGVPFPVWYKLNEAGEPDYGNPILADKLPCDPAVECPDGFSESDRGIKFIGDPDVMDTWATSALTPKIALSHFLPKKDRHGAACRQSERGGSWGTGGENPLPFDARWNGHEIIRTWDFYTILVAMLNDEKLPWKQLWINGFVLDKDHKKMSKSKGNVVVPQDLVDKYGPDAIRLWAASSKWGTDAAADEKIMGQKRKLVIKFFNAAKFIFGLSGKEKVAGEKSGIDEQWLNKLSGTAHAAKKFLIENDHVRALHAMESGFWDFCDNYLEIAKGRAYASDESALETLRISLETLCKVFAPFTPFITEEVWRQAHETSVHLETYPQLPAGPHKDYDRLCELVGLVRGKKSEAKKSIMTPISLVIADDPFFRAAETDIRNVLNAESITFSGPDTFGNLEWIERQ